MPIRTSKSHFFALTCRACIFSWLAVRLPVIGRQTVVSPRSTLFRTCTLAPRDVCLLLYILPTIVYAVRFFLESQQLSIISAHKARLQLEGRLQLDEPIEYSIHAESGELSFSLTESTRRLLRRFHTSLDAAGYEADEDVAWVVVWPPLPLSIRIRLNRITAEEGRRISEVGHAVRRFWQRPKLATADR